MIICYIEADSIQTQSQDAVPVPIIPHQPPAADTLQVKAKRGRPRKVSGAGDISIPETYPVKSKTQVAVEQAGSADLMEVDLNENRRKRQRTNSPQERSGGENGSRDQLAGVNATTQSQPGANHQTSKNNTDIISGPKHTSDEHTDLGENSKGLVYETQDQDLAPAISGGKDFEILAIATPGTIIPSQAETGDQLVINKGSKPKKTLHFNSKCGTLGSPPPKPNILVKPATRNRLGSSLKQPKTRLVVIRYKNDQLLSLNLGQKIEAILDGTRTAVSLSETVLQVPKPSKSTKVPGNGATTAHPFFRPKAAVVNTSNAPTSKPSHDTTINRGRTKKSPPGIDRPKSTVTSLERPQSKDRGSRQGTPTKKKPSTPRKNPTQMFPGFGNMSKIPKLPGVLEPAWPWKNMVHIRGLDRLDDLLGEGGNSWIECPAKEKKAKYQAMDVAPNENLISTLAARLSINEVVKSIQEVDLDEYPPVPPCLRPATRHFQAGPTIQRRIRKELRAPISWVDNEINVDTDEDEIQGHRRREKVNNLLPPKIFESLATNLSAFDQNQYETQLWTHKYSPQSAEEVLHNIPEALILKEWLQTLTLISTETAPGKIIGKRIGQSKPEPATKRVRKSKKLDDFVVSSGDEDNLIDELAELHDSPPGSQNAPMKSVVSTGTDDLGKSANGVVISGPHGCGKTAAVYAVAKELGFEVFEINSSSRRSGKDILDRVGDVMRNHIVRGTHSQHSEIVDLDTQRIADALDADLKSGRQGTMNSFFQMKEPAKINTTTLKVRPSSTKTNESITTKAPSRVIPKTQKQSLIFFEEVDVLYEEDKNFWNTVMAMVIGSKRPIVMTCTDESVIPIASLSLHAILRFTAPPVNIAADHMLLVAANEGHLIHHDAAKSLYESRNKDLRGSLTDLNFWCQFGVGDNKGTVDWICPRWPPGIDVDKNGNTLRVVSEGTYQAGMGWLCQDFLESNESHLNVETEMLRETQESWQLDASDWHGSIDFTDWAVKSQSALKEKKDKLAVLEIYGDFVESMSADDWCFGTAFAPENKRTMDASLPDMLSKAREDYPLGHGILEAEPFENFGSETIRVDISSWIKSRSRDHFQVAQHTTYGYGIPAQLDRPSEESVHKLIRTRSCKSDSSITRRDFSAAFDPISEPDTYVWKISSSLELSSFDRPMHLLVTDMAPYVRSIVSYDMRLSEERSRMSNLLSQGGQKTKRMRTTRAAMSALEGGARSTTRKERYFGPDLNPYLVLKTGLPSWLDAVAQSEKHMEQEHDNES